MFVLYLIICGFNGCTGSSVPATYGTKAVCEFAGREFIRTSKTREYVCIPGPYSAEPPPPAATAKPK